MNSVHFSEENEGFVCPKCTQISNSYDSLKEHIKENHPKSCNICNEEVKNMSAHIRTQHSDDSKKFKCEKCEFSTHTQKNLTQHIYVRHKKDEHKKCDICDKRFPQAFLLKQHMEITHKGENKRHICDKCGKSFAYKNGIKDHKCTPGVVKRTSWDCDKCDAVFKREMDYLQHHKELIKFISEYFMFCFVSMQYGIFSIYTTRIVSLYDSLCMK